MLNMLSYLTIHLTSDMCANILSRTASTLLDNETSARHKTKLLQRLPEELGIENFPGEILGEALNFKAVLLLKGLDNLE